MEADDSPVTDSFHSLTVIPPSALDKPSIMKRYHRRRTFSHTSRRRSPTMLTLHDTRLIECRWWNDGWTVKTVVTGRSSASTIPAPDIESSHTRDFITDTHVATLNTLRRCKCCHRETEAADQTFELIQSQCTDPGPACPSADL